MYTIVVLDRSWHLYHTVVYQAQLSFYKDHKHALMVGKWFHIMYFTLPKLFIAEILCSLITVYTITLLLCIYITT